MARESIVNFLLKAETAVEIDAWAAAQRDKPDRSEALQRLVDLGLKSVRSPKASELAAVQIDRLSDSSAPEEEQASRKRRLLQGPKEFREMRTDHPNTKR